jgi:hypothetical protein
LKSQGKIVVTPGKDLGRNRKKCISYDDRWVLFFFWFLIYFP